MLTTIATFREPWEAHMLRSRLDAEDIPAMVAHQFHVGVNWAQSTALGGVKVQVPEWFEEEAMRVERWAREGIYRSELEAEFGDLDDPRCPVCGSMYYARRRPYFSAVFAIAAVFLLRVVLPPRSWICTCRNCGSRFEQR